jgi:hypothetical protein
MPTSIEGELITLRAAGVVALNLGYATSTSVDAAGNAHKQIGSFVKTDGSARIATDVWFSADLALTQEVEILEVSADIAALPDMQGFGNVHSLHQAMARDETSNYSKRAALYTAETKLRKIAC